MGEASNVLCLLDPQNSFTFEHPGDGGRELRSRRNLFNYWFEGGSFFLCGFTELSRICGGGRCMH